MRVFEKLCVAAVVAGGVSLGAAGIAGAAAPAQSDLSFVDDSPAGSSAGIPNFLNSGVPDLGSSAGSVGSIPALTGFSGNLGICAVTSISGLSLCPG